MPPPPPNKASPTGTVASAADAALWRDVCLASAWFDKAQQALHTTARWHSSATADETTPTPTTTTAATTAAEKALALYQSCHRRVKKRFRRSGSSFSHHSLEGIGSSGSSSNEDGSAFTINLELRMAQTLRFLALVHSSSYSSSSDNMGDGRLLETAVKYHDMAVSLLVGVYDDDDDDNNDDTEGEEKGDTVGERSSHSYPQTRQGSSIESREPPSFSEEGSSGGQGGVDGRSCLGSRNLRTMLRIHVPNNHAMVTSSSNNAAAFVQSAAKAKTTQQSTTITFLLPTEDQRVRAIAVSLNALAELYARSGDDRAAMNSYREALEILNAATEEEEEDEEEDCSLRRGSFHKSSSLGTATASSSLNNNTDNDNGNNNSSSSKNSNASNISPIQADLANTLMNVGNFHLRRDELDAALNAYSTVWALHSGNSLDNEEEGNDDRSFEKDDMDVSTPGGGNQGSAASSLPYLTTPRTPVTPKVFSFSTPDSTAGAGGAPSSQSAATPNSAIHRNHHHEASSSSSLSSASSPGALAALNNLGIVHERKGELPRAVACFEFVHRARRAAAGDDHPDALNVLLNIGNCYQRMQRWEKAGEAYGDVIGMYRTIVKEREDEEALRQSTATEEDRYRGVRSYRSLAGALRNHGTCYWKQRRISEALDCLIDALEVEERIVLLLSSWLPPSPSSSSGEQQESALGDNNTAGMRQAKESMAQLLGLMGCLYLEYNHSNSNISNNKNNSKPPPSPLFHKSEEAFQCTIRLYEELGYDPSHPSIVWAMHNLAMVARLRDAPPPPPPPPPSATPTPPSLKAATVPVATASPLDDDEEGVIDMDDIDSIELDRVLKQAEDGQNSSNNNDDDDDTHDIFVGIEANSTDELDRILSEEAGGFASKKEGTEVEDEAVPMESNHDYKPTDEHIDGEKTNTLGNKPLSNDHRNISDSLFSAHSQEEMQGPTNNDDGDQEERVSQLQLQTGSKEGDGIEAADAHVALAEHFWEKGDRVAATDHYTEAHSIYQSQLGDSKEVAMVLKKLGDLNQEDGALDAARELYGAALEMEVTAHGQYLPRTLNAAGGNCLKADDFRSAMEFHRRALQIQKKSQAQQGGAKQKQKYEMYETLVRIGNVYYTERNDFRNIRSNGVDYREFIESGFLGWIANAHDMRGEYIKAIKFYEESLQIYMDRKGKEAKRETALTLNRLGSLTRELGRYDEAMDYHQKALNIQKTGSGLAKAMTAETCVLMGMVKSKMGEFKNALDLYEDSLLVLKNALGEGHSSSWKTMAQIGSVHFELSNYDQAMAVLLEVERSQLASVGDDDRDTLETQALLGRVLSANGQYEEAVEKLRDVCERQKKLFGSNHPTIADTLAYIGYSFLDQGMVTEARGQFVDCYNMRKKFFTVDQIHIADSMVDIIRARSGQPERALAIYRNAMEVYKEYLSDDHVQIGRLHVYEGDSYAELLNNSTAISTAIKHYKKARDIFNKAYEGECAIDSAMVAVQIGKVLLRKCEFDSAKANFTSALKIYQKLLPEGHTKIKSTLNHLDRVEQEEALCV